MKTHNSAKWVGLAAVVAGLTLANPVSAATPDGFGPWADGIAVVNQGMRKNGSPVLPERSDASLALGVAEGTQDTGTFYSLGMGGGMTLAFQNGISEGTFIVESTWEDFYYPTETAKVEISVDGIAYQEIGTVTKKNREVRVPEGFGCALFVRITDTSDPNIFENTADGFDIDGVRSVGETCATFGEVPNSCPDLTQSVPLNDGVEYTINMTETDMTTETDVNKRGSEKTALFEIIDAANTIVYKGFGILKRGN